MVIIRNRNRQPTPCRVYSIRPAEHCRSNRTENQYIDWRVLRRIGGAGMLWGRSGDAWLEIPGVKSKERNTVIARLLKQKKAIEVNVEGIEFPLYMRSEDAQQLAEIAECDCPSPQAAVLEPLDNLLWDRRLVKELFGFDYRWEVYKPASERNYGYYVLPVLYGDRFVARFEPGRDKKSGALIIKNWWWEPDTKRTEEVNSALLTCFKRFLDYLGTDKLEIDGDTVKNQIWNC